MLRDCLPLARYSGLRMLEFLLANNTKGSDAILTQAKTDVDDAIKALE